MLFSGGRGAAVKPASAIPQPASQESSATSEPVPGAPTLRIETESPVTAQSGGHLARVTSDTDLAFKWTIVGGSFEGSDDGDSVTWKAGAGAEVVLLCKGTASDGRNNSATLRVPLSPPGAITRFEAFPPVITEGTGAKLVWTVANAKKLVLEPGAQDLSGGASSSVDVKPEKTTSYTLTATDAAGLTTSQNLNLKVVPRPELLELRADPVSGSATAFGVVAAFKGGKAELKRGGQVIASGEASPLHLQLTDVEPGSSLTLTVTNEAGSFVSSTLTFSTRK